MTLIIIDIIPCHTPNGSRFCQVQSGGSLGKNDEHEGCGDAPTRRPEMLTKDYLGKNDNAF